MTVFSSKFSRVKVPRNLEIQIQQSECGLVCVSALLALAGARVRLPELRRHAGDTCRGLTIRQIRDLLRLCGATSEAVAFEADRIENIPTPSILLLTHGHFVVVAQRVKNVFSVFYPEHGWTKVGFDVLKGQMSPFAVTIGEIDTTRLPRRIEKRVPPVISAAIRANPARLFVVYAASVVAAQLLILALPGITGRLVDASGGVAGGASFGWAAVIYALVSCLAGLALAGGHYFSQTIAKRVGVRLGHATFGALEAKHPRWFEALPIDGVRNAVGAVDSVARMINASVASLLMGATSVVVSLVALILTSPWVATLALPLVFTTGAIDMIAESRQTRASVRLFDAVQRRSRFVGDSLGQFPLFARMGRLGALRERFIVMVQGAVEAEASMNVRRSAVGSVTGLVRAVDLLAFSFVSSLLMKSGTISLGEFVAASAYKAALTQGVVSLVQVGAQYRAMAPAIAQSSDLYTADEGVVEEVSQGNAPRSSVCLQGVSFGYGRFAAPILVDASMEIDQGEFVVVAGPSGSGKTTIAKLIGGLENADAGRIRLLGKAPELGMAGVALVLQSDRLIDGSIRDNVSLLDATIEDDAILEALGLVGFDAFVRSLPMGLSTAVGEGRGGLSAGQRQRILLARAMVGRPSVVVLDEATSNIDVQLEAKILQAIRSTGATVVLISHRPEAWSGADQIFDLADGRLSRRRASSSNRPRIPVQSLAGGA